MKLWGHGWRLLFLWWSDSAKWLLIITNTVPLFLRSSGLKPNGKWVWTWWVLVSNKCFPLTGASGWLQMWTDDFCNLSIKCWKVSFFFVVFLQWGWILTGYLEWMLRSRPQVLQLLWCSSGGPTCTIFVVLTYSNLWDTPKDFRLAGAVWVIDQSTVQDEFLPHAVAESTCPACTEACRRMA